MDVLAGFLPLTRLSFPIMVVDHTAFQVKYSFLESVVGLLESLLHAGLELFLWGDADLFKLPLLLNRRHSVKFKFGTLRSGPRFILCARQAAGQVDQSQSWLLLLLLVLHERSPELCRMSFWSCYWGTSTQNNRLIFIRVLTCRSLCRHLLRCILNGVSFTFFSSCPHNFDLLWSCLNFKLFSNQSKTRSFKK